MRQDKIMDPEVYLQMQKAFPAPTGMAYGEYELVPIEWLGHEEEHGLAGKGSPL